MDLNNERRYYYEYNDKTQLFFVYEHGNDKIIKNAFDKEHKARQFCETINHKKSIDEIVQIEKDFIGSFDNKEEYLFTDEQRKVNE